MRAYGAVYKGAGINIINVQHALIIAGMAFQRTGGTKELGKTTAELLAKMEKGCEKKRQPKWRRKKHRNKQNHMGGIKLLQNTKYHNYRYVIRLFLALMVISAVLRRS
jgi:hypothetical protein